ncbi:MAG: phosphatidylserine/phosphatidylglycerophosphate/cardiolipin synthase family protein [Candidatus Odinarchaeota archaeon]
MLRRYAVLILITMLILPSFAVALTPDVTEQFETAEFTLQTFNRNMNVTTFVGPDYSNETLTQFLRSAQESIYVEIYQFTSPGLLALIHEVYNDNPSLDIKVMISERVVSEGEYNTYTMWNLTQLGIPVRWTSDTFTFSHQKFVIIDNKTTIVQAGNWARPSVPLNDWQTGTSGNLHWKNYEGNREFNIAMTDTIVTNFYRSVFDNDWKIGTDYNESTDGTGTVLNWGSISFVYYPRVFNYTGHFLGPMNVTPFVSPDTSLEAMLWVINSAQATLDIEIPYISNSSIVVDELLDAIVAAKHRGVTVRIITEEGRNDNPEVALAFAEENIPVIWMDLRFFAAIHNKAFIADGRIVLICSVNWSEESISENREAGVIIEHNGIGAWYQAVFDYDWGLADYDTPEYVNVGWSPHIPNSSAEINVTVYAHEYYNDIDEVKLGVKINDGSWTNYTITSNAYLSAELNLENFFHVIGPQPDGTNITVIAYVESLGVESRGLEMVIPVRDSIGSVITTPTPTTTPESLVQLIMDLAPYIALAIVAAVAGVCLKKKR